MKELIKRFLIYILSVLVCFACNTQSFVKDEDINIILSNAQSDKFDLKSGTYTRYFLRSDSVSIQLNLSNEEKTKIIDAYYKFHVYEITGSQDPYSDNIYILDKCNIAPKSYSSLIIRGNKISQNVQIDLGCNSYSFFVKQNANRAKNLIRVINEIVYSRISVKKLPHSDFIYL